MKIALLHFSVPPIVGGVESVMGQHSRLMAKAGHEVCLIGGRGATVDEQVAFRQIPLADSRHPVVLSAKATLDAGHVPDNFEQLVAGLESELSAAVAGFDVLIAHNVCSLHKNLALTAALRQVCGRPGAPRLIAWHHDLAWTAARYEGELHDGWPWDLIRADWSEIEPVHAVVSEYRRRELASLFGLPAKRISVVPSGLDMRAFLKLEATTAAISDGLGLRQAEPLFLLPVRITRRKNIELAIRTLAALESLLPRPTLLVTGPPGAHNPTNQAYFAQLLALRDELGLRPNPMSGRPVVHFLAETSSGYLQDSVIADLFRLADALLLPSRDEGFGIPMIEAGLSGIPIFCADLPPLRELGIEDVTYFSPDVDPPALANLIVTRLKAEQTYRLRLRVRKTFSWDNIYDRHVAPLLGEN